MSEVFQRPEDVDLWRAAARGDAPDWTAFPSGCVAAVDWPASIFWRELAAAHPEAVIVLTTRRDATQWWESCDATILPYARGDKPSEDENWLAMFREQLAREIGENWDDAAAAHATTNGTTPPCAPMRRPIAWSSSPPAPAGSRSAPRSVCPSRTSRSRTRTRGRSGRRDATPVPDPGVARS